MSILSKSFLHLQLRNWSAYKHCRYVHLLLLLTSLKYILQLVVLHQSLVLHYVGLHKVAIDLLHTSWFHGSMVEILLHVRYCYGLWRKSPKCLCSFRSLYPFLLLLLRLMHSHAFSGLRSSPISGKTLLQSQSFFCFHVVPSLITPR